MFIDRIDNINTVFVTDPFVGGAPEYEDLVSIEKILNDGNETYVLTSSEDQSKVVAKSNGLLSLIGSNVTVPDNIYISSSILQAIDIEDFFKINKRFLTENFSDIVGNLHYNTDRAFAITNLIQDDVMEIGADIFEKGNGIYVKMQGKEFPAKFCYGQKKTDYQFEINKDVILDVNTNEYDEAPDFLITKNRKWRKIKELCVKDCVVYYPSTPLKEEILNEVTLSKIQSIKDEFDGEIDKVLISHSLPIIDEISILKNHIDDSYNLVFEDYAKEICTIDSVENNHKPCAAMRVISVSTDNIPIVESYLEMTEEDFD